MSFFFFKQKTAYEMRISDWSSDVCSSDLLCALLRIDGPLFLDLAKELPPEIFQQVKRNAPWLVRSLNGSIAEIRLLDEIRRIVTASAATAQCPDRKSVV